MKTSSKIDSPNLKREFLGTDHEVMYPTISLNFSGGDSSEGSKPSFTASFIVTLKGQKIKKKQK